MPLISIIIPIYNAEDTLNRCHNCILNQTFYDWELLLIDDGSTDLSGELCDEYASKDQRIKVFHKKNGGVSSARNVGLDYAKGEWITFCDSDDFVCPNWLKNYTDNISDGIDLICQAFEDDKTFELNNKKVFGINYKGCVQDAASLLYENDILGYLWVKLFKRSVIEFHKLRFDPHFNYWEDQEFCFRYFSCIKNLVCTKDVGYYYHYPDCASKYPKKNNMFYMYLSLYKSAMIIYNGKINDMIIRILDDYISVLFSLYKNRHPLKRKYLMEFRMQVGKNIMKSHLFPLTKLFIYLDMTTYISDMIIKLHIKFK